MTGIIAQNDTTGAEDVLFNRTVKAYGTHVPSPRPADSFFKYAYNGMGSDEMKDQAALYLIYFLYGVRYRYSRPQVLQCLPTHVGLELQVECRRSSKCDISQMRRKPAIVKPHNIREGKFIPPSRCDLNNATLPCLLLDAETLQFFIDSWATVLSTPTQDNGTDPFIIYITALPDDEGYHEINAEALSACLTLAFNTYWQAISWQGLTMRTNPFNLSELTWLDKKMASTDSREEFDALHLSNQCTVDCRAHIRHAYAPRSHYHQRRCIAHDHLTRPPRVRINFDTLRSWQKSRGPVLH